MMSWWPIVGMSKMLTKKEEYTSRNIAKRLKLFKRSMHLYMIDVGNSNQLNFEIHALHTPRYNIHRFGIYFAASPRHADLLVVLGRPTKKMVEPLKETIKQLPDPFGILMIKGCEEYGIDPESLNLPNVVGIMQGCPSASEILGMLLKISGRID
jgi:Ni,Fe-hydrogenase III small subunit